MRLSQFTAAVLLPATALIGFSTPAAAQESANKLNAYIDCSNRISGRAYEARERYFSWVGKAGPTGKEKVVYGTYTIYSTADCAKSVVTAKSLEPHDEELEAAASEYVAAVVVLEPLLKEADDYYSQGNHKDDKMAKGRALHPRLVAAWNAFAVADKNLSAGIDRVSDAAAIAELAAIEKTDGRKGRYHIKDLMIKAKRLVDVQGSTPNDLAKITSLLAEFEAIVKSTEDYAAAHGRDSKIGSSFIGSAKTFLTSSKNLMRRVRDKVPYNQGEQMIMRAGNASWMVEGSPARLTRDYNQLIESYNRDASF